jgi:hypothetical protein
MPVKDRLSKLKILSAAICGKVRLSAIKCDYLRWQLDPAAVKGRHRVQMRKWAA